MHRQSSLLVEMVGQNNTLTEQISELMNRTSLTRTVHELTGRIETLTMNMSNRLAAPRI